MEQWSSEVVAVAIVSYYLISSASERGVARGRTGDDGPSRRHDPAGPDDLAGEGHTTVPERSRWQERGHQRDNGQTGSVKGNPGERRL